MEAVSEQEKVSSIREPEFEPVLVEKNRRKSVGNSELVSVEKSYLEAASDANKSISGSQGSH